MSTKANSEYKETIKAYSEAELEKDYNTGSPDKRYWIMRELLRRDNNHIPYWQRVARMNRKG